jgi:undecaprenyl-diphosphatase
MELIQYLIAIDQKIFRWINHHIHFYALDYLMIVLSSTEFWISIAMLLLFYSLYRKDYKSVLVLVLVLMVVAILDPFSHFVLKPYFERLRPCKVSGMESRYILGCGGWYSFPSNHAVNSAATVAVVWMFNGFQKTKILFVCAFLVGFSRIYLGVHYPLDIFAGFLIGFSFASAFSWFAKKTLVKFWPNSFQNLI